MRRLSSIPFLNQSTYRKTNGFSTDTHARAESNSLLFGRTVVTVGCSDYHLQLSPAK
jgi:hypothetical protein